MTGFETLACEVRDGIATLTLDRPARLNAIDRRMADEIPDALAALGADPAVRVLILRGAGGNFSAGGDVKDMAALGPRTHAEALAGMARYRRLALALHGFERPVIAAADGVAYGAGMSLLLLADLVLLSDRARLCLAFQRIGLVPDCGALFTLPRRIGLQQAKALAFTAREIGPHEALALGFALEVLSPDALDARARALATEIAAGPAFSLALAKRALDASLQSDLPTVLALEAESQAAALVSDGHREALARRARSPR